MDDDQHALVQLRGEDWTWRLASHPVPIVAAVNGVAHGMGAIIASCADLRIAAASATFRITATKYGGANLTWNLPLLIGWSHTKDLLLTSRTVSAQEAAGMGFANRVVPDQEVLSEALSVARSIAELPPEGVREVKRLLHEGAGAGLRARYDSEHVA